MVENETESAFVTGVPLVIITGLSGAGKSTAMRFLEDLGCYCVDNLPPALIPEFFNLYQQSSTVKNGVVIASDVRSGDLFEDFAETVSSLKESEVDFEILFLDCDTDTLIRRFKEVRRTLMSWQPVDQAAKYLMARNEGKKLPLTKQIVCHLGRVGRVPQHLISAEHGHGARHYHNGIYYDARGRLSVTTSCSIARLWTQYAKNHYNRVSVHYHHMFRGHELEFSEVDYLRGACRDQVREMIGRAHGIRDPASLVTTL